MKQVSTGVGLCVLGLCIVGYPLAERLASRAEAGVPGAALAVAAAATAQDPPAPTIVWYSVTSEGIFQSLYRAWSDGRVEVRRVQVNGWLDASWCAVNPAYPCVSQWYVVNNPAQGLTFDADLNFDEAVDGVDLGMLLGKWGPAPRNPVPPSDCPLALINP